MYGLLGPGPAGLLSMAEWQRAATTPLQVGPWNPEAFAAMPAVQQPGLLGGVGDMGQDREARTQAAPAGADPYAGRSPAVSWFSSFAPAPVGTIAGIANASNGLIGTNRHLEAMGRSIGQPVQGGFGDYFRGATGFGGGAYSRGIGGYGNIGMQGIAGQMNMIDPGVAGPARAQAIARDRDDARQREANRDRYGGSAGRSVRDDRTGRLGGGV